MSSPYGSPPPSNPVLTAYESFVKDTPLVTRYTLTALTWSYLISWFVDPRSTLQNSPLHSILSLELYRIILAPLVCTDLLTLIFAFLSFLASGKRLEYSVGSTAFLTIILALGGVTNIVFLLLCIFMFVMTKDNIWLLQRSFGIWTIILGMIAMECAKAPPGTSRRLFFLTVPTLYYPVAILVLFALMSQGFNFVYILSVVVGYAFGFDKLTFLQPSTNRCSSWESGCLSNFTQRHGWVVGQAATGSSAWETLPTTVQSQQQGQGWTPTTFFRGNRQSSQQQQQQQQPRPTPRTFASGSGRSLGGGESADGLSIRPNAREAMLEAAERRASQQSQQNSD